MNSIIKKIKLKIQSAIAANNKNGVKILSPFNGEITARKTIVIITIEIIASRFAKLMFFICCKCQYLS